MIKISVTVAKIENKFPVKNLSWLRFIDARLGVLVAYFKRQLGIAARVSVDKVNVTVA